jgi:hypothetical protein
MRPNHLPRRTVLTTIAERRERDARLLERRRPRRERTRPKRPLRRGEPAYRRAQGRTRQPPRRLDGGRRSDRGRSLRRPPAGGGGSDRRSARRDSRGATRSRRGRRAPRRRGGGDATRGASARRRDEATAALECGSTRLPARAVRLSRTEPQSSRAPIGEASRRTGVFYICSAVPVGMEEHPRTGPSDGRPRDRAVHANAGDGRSRAVANRTDSTHSLKSPHS